MFKQLSIVLLCGLAGCTTWGQMNDGLAALQGQPLDSAIRVLGYPSGEQTIAGRRLVVWSSQSTGMMYMPQTATTYGNVYAPSGFASYNQTTSYGTMVPLHHQCKITMEVDAANTITGYSYDGNMGGCSRYIKSLQAAAG